MTVKLHESNNHYQGNHASERFERKYYVVPQKVSLAYGLLNHICIADKEFHSEQINSLYFDTVGLDQHERSSSGDFEKDKIRIRWYGNKQNPGGMQTVFLELKSRRGFSSTKQRLNLHVPVEDLHLNNLHKGIIERTALSDTLSGFGYFPGKPVLPVIQISYWRYRFSDLLTGQTVSLDCNIRSTMIIPGIGNGVNELKLPGAVIEIKSKTMEFPFTLQKLKMLYLDWSRYSKYSSCIDAHSDHAGTVGYLSPSGKIIQQ